ncbi:MAG TPA: GIY-YIG nuclease family protein [Chthoniobacterales bacterium]|nr:GIY-YIG nuclease family protein [Chthoniobacterales bacterium]
MKILEEPDIIGSFVCPNVPEVPGVYVVTDDDGHVLYVGRSDGLRRRTAYLLAHVYDTSSGRYLHDGSEPLLALQAKGETASVHYLSCPNVTEREQALIAKYDPPWNKRK